MKTKKKEKVPEVLEVKIMVWGGARAVGKTSLINALISGQFYDYYEGIEDQWRKQLKVEDRMVILEMFEEQAWEHFTAMRDLYIKLSTAFMLVYSTTSHESFAAIKDKLAVIQEVAVRLDVDWLQYTVLVGTKTDLDSRREVSYEQGQALARELGCLSFHEVSAARMQNVQQPFHDIVRPAVVAERKYGNNWRNHLYLPIPCCSIANPTHQQRLSQDMRALINSEKYYDMAFVAEGRELRVSRAILLLRCASILEGYGPQDERIEMKGDVSYDSLYKIIEWIYTGHFEPPPPKSEARQQMRTAVIRCKVYYLLPYLSMDDDAEDKEKEKEQEKEKETARGPNFGMIFNESAFSDITLVLDDGEKLLAHRILLVARAGYFRAMFDRGFRESQQSEVHLKDTLSGAFKLLVYYMYTDQLDGCPGDIHFEEHIEDLLGLGDLYGVTTIGSAVQAKLCEMVQVTNAASLYYIAHTHNLEPTKAIVEHYISYRLDQVRQTEDYQQNLPDELKVALRNVKVAGEWFDEEEEAEHRSGAAAQRSSGKKSSFFARLRSKK